MKTSVTFAFTLLFIVVGLSYLYLNPSDPKPLELSSAQMGLLSAEDREIRLIQIQNLDKNGIVTLERAGDAWMIRYPIRYPADTRIVEGLAAALKYSKKARRLPAQGDWKEYGLSRPSLKVGIETQRSGKRKYLYLGDPSPVGTFVFARWEGEKEYFLIQREFKNVFDVSLYSLRRKQLFTLPSKEISKIKVRTFSQGFELEKRGGDWFWTEPVVLLGAKIAENRMHRVLSLYGSLHVKEFLEKESVDTKNVFPTAPALVRIFAGDGSREGLILGEEVPAREAYYAKQEDGTGEVFLVSKERIQDFFSLIHEIAQKSPPSAQ